MYSCSVISQQQFNITSFCITKTDSLAASGLLRSFLIGAFPSVNSLCSSSASRLSVLRP